MRSNSASNFAISLQNAFTFRLNLKKPIELNIHADEKDLADILAAIKPYVVE